MLLHELTHKRHWDRAKALYKANSKKYNKVEDAKRELDAELVSYVKKQLNISPKYGYDISEYAVVYFVDKNNINELVAEVMVKKERVQDRQLVKLVEEVLGNDENAK